MKQKRFSEERIIKLLQDAKQGEKPIEELCRGLGAARPPFTPGKRNTAMPAWTKPGGFVSSNVKTSAC
ncbi:hypothetical protein [Deinococcus sp. YIM 77859]|uniref:hypothetical protein n=1 Tax=Deinococcus sp. YIM 77859 TaxID=1540221 RepID=UPI0012E08763|nr:hypothetical protein [Deinococcus sp. YIM 77859]